jgi:hypothetical protein
VGDKSVEGWLAAIHEASFVVTDSFHGTAFSILFNKPFMAYGNPKRGLARFASLLKMFGLEDRLAVRPDEIDVERMLEPIDWDAVNERLEKLRADSRRFLLSALSGAVSSRKPLSSLPNGAGSDGVFVDRPPFAANNAAWLVAPLEHATKLTVAPNSSMRGNLVWCDLPCPILKQVPYRLTIKWVIRTMASEVDLYIRNKVTHKFRRIGTIGMKGITGVLRADSIEFSVAENGFSQLMLGAVRFTGEHAGAEIASIAVRKLTTAAATRGKNSSTPKNPETALKGNE